jgi:lysozyme
MAQPLLSNSSPITAQNRVRTMIRSNEGFTERPFLDTEGNRTVGIGFNISDPSIAKFVPRDVQSGQRALTVPEAKAIFDEKLLPIALGDAKSFVGDSTFSNLDPVRQRVLIDLSFNLGGPRLKTFKKLRSAIIKGDFQTAATELLDSKYATQVPNRARRNAQLLLTGGQ